MVRPLPRGWEWGFETPTEEPVAEKSGAGWHARMSNRLAGKGACALLRLGFEHPAHGRRPERNIGAMEAGADD